MTHAERIAKMLADTRGKHYQQNNWGSRHCDAWRTPDDRECGIVTMIRGAATYADAHAARFESNVGDDGFLGEPWGNVLKSVRTLLNGECGRLDCGTVDKLILDMLAAEGLGDE